MPVLPTSTSFQLAGKDESEILSPGREAEAIKLPLRVFVDAIKEASIRHNKPDRLEAFLCIRDSAVSLSIVAKTCEQLASDVRTQGSTVQLNRESTVQLEDRGASNG